MNDAGLCIFGEVLFDHFPDGSRVLGGAPFNVAWHLQAFGQAPRFVSRIGTDAEGDTVHAAMRDWGMSTAALQRDDAHSTGRVRVRFEDGEPAYEIVHPVAYDAIEALPAPGGDGACNVLYHGSLATRDPRSRAALAAIRTRRPGLVFVDVNLRDPWWDRDGVLGLLHGADWVKLNTAELGLLGGEDGAGFVAAHGLCGLILTHGADGAEVITAEGERYRVAPRREFDVVDTVGAGDAFASVMLLGLMHDWPLPRALERAQDFASRIVGRRGATVAEAAFYAPLRAAWGLAEA